MIAVGIVAFAVVGILTAFPVGIKAGQDARDEDTAAFIADQVFAMIRAQSFSTLRLPQAPTYYTAAMTDQWAMSGSTTTDANTYFFAVDGMPANASSGGSLGTKMLGTTYKSDQAYFAARIYRIHVDPYYVPSNPTYNVISDPSMGYSADFNDSLSSLAYVAVEISWPARVPYLNRVTGHIRVYHSAIVNLH